MTGAKVEPFHASHMKHTTVGLTIQQGDKRQKNLSQEALTIQSQTTDKFGSVCLILNISKTKKH